jgi:hypothetical protein
MRMKAVGLLVACAACQVSAYLLPGTGYTSSMLKTSPIVRQLGRNSHRLAAALTRNAYRERQFTNRVMCSAAAANVDKEAQSLALAGGRMKVKEIAASSDTILGKEIVVKGWVRTVRSQKAFSFIELNDGSAPKGIQVLPRQSRFSIDVCRAQNNIPTNPVCPGVCS